MLGHDDTARRLYFDKDGSLQEVRSGRGRGLSEERKRRIEAAYEILEEIEPATVRAVCYQLFMQGLISSMSKVSETQKVSRDLVLAREEGLVPWTWIVDETREAERVSQWRGLAEFGETVLRAYRKDFWRQQPVHIEVWSEKGTVRGTLAPVLNEFAITFRVMHGFGGASAVHDIAQETTYADKPFLVFYVGDYDPSGMFMSERDLPERLERYGGKVTIERLALTEEDILDPDLPGFSAHEKHKDPRYNWFLENYGDRCWELDALSPSILRERVRDAIKAQIEPVAWERCRKLEAEERKSLREFKWA
jgi:hypothetical protein